MGTPEENKALVRRFLDARGSGDVVADGDRVVHHSRFTTVRTGEVLGVSATGRRVTVDHVDLWRIDGDRIVEHRGGAEMERLHREPAGGDDG